MKQTRGGPPQSVPTLTEVIDWPPAELAPKNGPVEERPLAPAPQPVREPPNEPLPEHDPPAAPEPAPESPPGPVDEPPPPPLHAQFREGAGSMQRSTPTVLDERQLTERVLAELQRQIESVLEYRMREVLTPILSRATDAIVRDARSALTASLRDLVAQSVAQELRRQRDG